MKMKKRLLGVLLGLAMVLGLMPGMSLTAYAAGEDITSNINIVVSGSCNSEDHTVSSDDEDEYTVKEGVVVTFKCSKWFTDAVRIYLNGTAVATWPGYDYNSEYRWTAKKDAKINWAGYRQSSANIYLTETSTVAVNSVTLAPTTATLTVGDVKKVEATVLPANATNKTVKWSVGGTNSGAVKLYTDANCTTAVGTDATSTLTVYAKGISAGSATVTATSNADSKKKASCDVTVNAAGYDVTITAGSNMTKTEASGAASQTGLSGAMTDVVYTADTGYYFPENYSVEAVNGISVTRNSYTQITVSGTPTANAAITLTAPTAKTTPDAPTTAAAVDCTTANNNDGKLTGVTTAMEYKKSDADSWTAGTGNDITGLIPGTYYVRLKATDTANASANQELTIADSLTAKKTAAKADLDTLLAGKTEADYDADDWTTLTQAIADGKAAIDNATTIDGVTTAKTNAEASANAVKTTAEKLADAKTAAKADLDTLLAGKTEADYDAEDWTTLTQAIADGKTAIDNATTIDGVTTAKSNAETAVNAIKTKAEKLADAKTAAKADLDTLLGEKTEADYDADDWTTLTQAITDGKTAIDNATTIDVVTTAKTNAETAVNAIKTKAEKLADAKTAAKADLDTLLDGKTEADYDADDWTTLTQAIADGKTAIDNATTIDGVTTAKTNAETAVNAIKTKAEKLADAKTAAKADLDTLLAGKTEADYDADDWTTLTQAITNGKAAIDNATTIDGVTTAKSNAEASANAVKTKAEKLTDAKTAAKADLDTLLAGKTEADYDADDWTTLTQAIADGKAAIDNATTINDVATAKSNAETAANAVKTTAEKLADAKTAAKADLDTLLGEKTEADYDADDWTTLTQAIADGKAAIDNATTIDGVTTAKSNAEASANAVKTKAEKLTDAKTAAKADLDTLLAGKTEADYDADDWTTLTQAIADGKTAIDNATTTDDVATAKSNAETAANAVKTTAEKAAEALAAAKTAAKADLDTLLAGKTEADYDADDWTTLTQAIADGKTAIDNATTIDDVATAKSNAEASANAVKTTAEKKEEADTAAANGVSDTINNLPAANEVTTANKNAIEAARAAYNALTDDQKAKVSADTLKKLTDAEDALAAATVSATIDALPAAADVTTANKDAIEAARAAYNALTDAEKRNVPKEMRDKLREVETALWAVQVEESEKPVYNGGTQELVTPGIATGGTMYYALGADKTTAPAFYLDDAKTQIDTSKWSTSVPEGTDAGTYYVWYIVKGDENHNDSEPKCVESTIAKKGLTVTADAKSKTQGEADPALTYTAEGLVAGDTLTGALSREAGEDPGTYAITQGTLTAGDNYEITFISAVLTINKKEAPAPSGGGGGYYGGGTVQNQRRDAYSDVIGAAATNFWGSSPERIRNIELACEKLDGIILQPGEVFSFNEAVGGLTAEAGFEVAPVNPKDEATAEMGGGVSQVASTLYTGSLFALLETVERTNHPFAVPFIQPGTDACVTDPGNADALDLKFRNTRSEPIRISAKTRVDEARQVREIVIELRSALGSSDYMPIRFDNTWGGEQNAFLTATPYDLTRPGYRILLTHEEQAFTDDRGTGIRTLTHRKILDAAGMLVRDEILNSKLPDGSYAMDTYYQG